MPPFPSYFPYRISFLKGEIIYMENLKICLFLFFLIFLFSGLFVYTYRLCKNTGKHTENINRFLREKEGEDFASLLDAFSEEDITGISYMGWKK